MTRKIFWDDPYQTQLDTHVTGVQQDDVTVAETILYAFSGGQESDAGSIGGHPVLAARKDGAAIVYTLATGHGLRPGEAVTITLDWARRYRLMRLHFAAEIVLELVFRQLPAIEKVGAHIARDKARIDFRWHENISAIFPLIQQQARAIVDADHDIVTGFSDAETQRRYWQVSGFSQVPCGGTHVRRTGEIGALTLKRNNIGKGKERIEIYLADRA